MRLWIWKTPRIKGTCLRVLTVGRVDRLMEMPSDHAAWFADRAMLELMYGTGIRVSEMLALKNNDINLTAGFFAMSG